MDVNNWFEVEDPEEYGEEPWDFDEAELAFLAALRARAADWQVPWDPSQVGRPEDESSFLVRWGAPAGARPVGRALLRHTHAGRESPRPALQPSRVARAWLFRASGTVEELAERCAGWFESLLSRPVVRVEWPFKDGKHATHWEFAKTGEILAPRGSIPADGSSPAYRLPVRP
ncbi:hypothetical protein [Streptomyces sp. NBC_01171]|uniref:hypothetical protein n=1 Tax=Streptomyces sp. NBC_01171 TaxID=2903757 RepID=UPI003869C700|nr:hypothetical protein OG448_30400 [Streptomyces sp. NBC_01171]